MTLESMSSPALEAPTYFQDQHITVHPKLPIIIPHPYAYVTRSRKGAFPVKFS